jgi:N6-adenosine-specific RNA methylase IME4
MSAPEVWEGLNPPYRTIVADPPWPYEGRTPPWRSGRRATYSLMSLDDICRLPISDIAAPDAHLYLWATLPCMADAYAVVKAWDFDADTVLTWCKPGPGLGQGFRANTEHLIVARRGCFYENPTCALCGGRARGATKCSCENSDWRHQGLPIKPPRRAFLSTTDGSWYEAPRGQHSEKPQLFADLVEQMSPGPYVELFAREPRLGWDSWGYGYETATA